MQYILNETEYSEFVNFKSTYKETIQVVENLRADLSRRDNIIKDLRGELEGVKQRAYRAKIQADYNKASLTSKLKDALEQLEFFKRYSKKLEKDNIKIVNGINNLIKECSL